MARILGLDLGSFSVKAVTLETTLRSAAVKGFIEVPVQNGDLKAALGELLVKNPVNADQIIVSMPGLSLATHPISLPFSDPKRIESTLAFEVEDELPFDLTEAVYDYQVASLDNAGSQLLVGVVKKAELAKALDVLKELKLEPRIVTHPGLAAQSLLMQLPPNENAVAIVDIGHERTVASVGRVGHGVELARTFAGGGVYLTRALGQEFKIPPAEAQTWKDQHAALGEYAVGDDAERAAAAFIRGLQPVLRELKATFKQYSAHTRRHVDAVYLCGGTAKMPGLAAQLAGDLGINVGVLELPNEAKQALGGPSPQAAQAYALALRGNASGARAQRFNLRRGEFAFKSDFDFVSDKLGQLVTFGAVLLVLLIASSIVRNTVLERRVKAINASMCDIMQRYVGKCDKAWETDFRLAKGMLEGHDSPAANIPKKSAVNLLAELTARLPADVPVTTDQMIVDLDRISARFETDSSKHVEDIVAALKTFKCFKEVSEGKLEKSKDGSKVTFRLDIEVDCPAEGST
jgi:general secretion pathway protein L